MQIAGCVSYLDIQCVQLLPSWKLSARLGKRFTNNYSIHFYVYGWRLVLAILCPMKNIIDFYCSIYYILLEVCQFTLHKQGCDFMGGEKYQPWFFVYCCFDCKKEKWWIYFLLDIQWGHWCPWNSLKHRPRYRETLQTPISFHLWCCLLHHWNGVSSVNLW